MWGASKEWVGVVDVIKTRIGLLAVVTAAGLALAACGGSDEGEPASTAAATTAVAGETPASTAGEDAATTTPSEAGTDLSAVKAYLLEHAGLLTGFTADLAADAQAYYDLAEAAGFDAAAIAADPAAAELLEHMKEDWIEGNPFYERMEGVVAGTPSLAAYDVILDAGSSAAEDPESAVPFDLTLADGTVLKQPGNLFNLTEGALWGTLPDDIGAPQSTPVDLDGDGTEEFGEVVPDAGLLLAAGQAFDTYAKELAASAEAWQPSESDALTALVVMVPTMGEYFGQWKESRFVAGDSATSASFNVVSRLSDINDILGGLDVIYGTVQPLVATADESQAQQTGQELDDLIAFITDLYETENAGDAFSAEEADTLGTEAQARAEAIAGQISQAAAQLGITIEQ
jgi:hypothetical protein